jgi:hypothetical protein
VDFFLFQNEIKMGAFVGPANNSSSIASKQMLLAQYRQVPVRWLYTGVGQSIDQTSLAKCHHSWLA